MTPKFLPIYLYDHTILRTKSEDIIELTQDVKQLCMNMRFTMHNAQGIGLAANQIGENINIICVGQFGPNRVNEILINPKITWEDDVQGYAEEGCLSIPGLKLNIKRPINITVEYLNERFEPCEYTTNRPYLEHECKENNCQDHPMMSRDELLTARVIQHEIQHLSGILTLDVSADPLTEEQTKHVDYLKRNIVVPRYKFIAGQ